MVEMDLLLVNSYPFVWMIARQNKYQSGERPLRYQHICRQGDGCPVLFLVRGRRSSLGWT